MRSAELTRPGFVHDVCSAIHPMALGSPFLRDLPLAEHGLELIHPPAPLAHPFDDGTAAILERSVEATAKGLGADAESYRRLMGPLAGAADAVIGDLFGPLRAPRHPLATARFGFSGLRSANGLANRRFDGAGSRAVRRCGRALHAAAHQPDQRGGRTGPGADGACVRLAAGPRRLAADRRGHGLHICASWAARSPPRTRSRRLPSSRRAQRSCSISPRARSFGSPATGYRPATGAGWLATATGRDLQAGLGPSTDRFPGAPRAAAARPRCTSGQR